MARKKQKAAFDVDGFCREFAESPHSAGCIDASLVPLEGNKRARRDLVRGACPETPGVYGFVNSENHLIYVGMSRHLRNRVSSYFSTGRRTKETRVGRRGAYFLWQPAVHPLIARLRELELIRRFTPALNVEGHPWRMREAYVVLKQGEAGHFELKTDPAGDFAAVWGPIPMNRANREAVEELNRYFGLRDCPSSTPMNFSDDGIEVIDSRISCIRADTASCLAPCIGNCSRAEYAKAIRTASRFLEGKTTKVIDELNKKMQEASQQQRFERATRYRNSVQALERLDMFLRKFHDWREEATFVYPVDDGGQVGKRWLVVVRGVIQCILSPQTAAETRKTLEQILAAPHAFPIDPRTNQFQSARVVHKWFRKYPDEAKNTLTLKQAIARCRRKVA
ncbi:MAG: UvrB/UvrC motif-containing protein [Planctomycetaceae bacterium]